MKYSDMALKVFAAKELGIIKSNAQFWGNFEDSKKFEEVISGDVNFSQFLARVSDEFIFSKGEGGIVCAYDDDFPVINHKVKNNSEKPYLLFYKGDLALLNDLNRNVAVIGLLDPDEKIMKRESKVVKKLVENDMIVVSGLALGCDTIAHKTCLESDGKTIAILPSPIDKVYPSKNRNLAQEIVNKGGLLLTEYYKPPATRSEAIKRLIERDRLQAMFAKVIILIASYRKGEGDSGSRHAMEAARKYEIERYVMYDCATDNGNGKFGLNKDLVNQEGADKVKILQTNSINHIRLSRNPNLLSNFNPINKQLTIFDIC